ncbi:MAG: hypothetical protein WA139_02090 [Candidatus Aenigmatarchaeota archaeon]
MSEIIIVAIIGGIFGSIITYLVKFFFDKNKERFLSELQQKEKRYKCTMVFMECYLHPKNIKFLRERSPENQTVKDIKETLKVEYAETLLFAPDDVVKSLKSFIESPSEEKYYETIKLMRKDLWGKKTKLSVKDMRI